MSDARQNAAQIAARNIKSKPKRNRAGMPMSNVPGSNNGFNSPAAFAPAPSQGQTQDAGGLFGGSVQASGGFNFAAPGGAPTGLSFPAAKPPSTNSFSFGNSAVEQESDYRLDTTGEEAARRNKPFRISPSPTFQAPGTTSFQAPGTFAPAQSTNSFGQPAKQENLAPGGNIFSFGQNSTPAQNGNSALSFPTSNQTNGAAFSFAAPAVTSQTAAPVSAFNFSPAPQGNVENSQFSFGQPGAQLAVPQNPSASFTFGAATQPSTSTPLKSVSSSFTFGTNPHEANASRASTPSASFTFGSTSQETTQPQAAAPQFGFGSKPLGPGTLQSQTPSSGFKFGTQPQGAEATPQASNSPFKFGTAPQTSQLAQPSAPSFHFGSKSEETQTQSSTSNSSLSLKPQDATPASSREPSPSFNFLNATPNVTTASGTLFAPLNQQASPAPSLFAPISAPLNTPSGASPFKFPPLNGGAISAGTSNKQPAPAQNIFGKPPTVTTNIQPQATTSAEVFSVLNQSQSTTSNVFDNLKQTPTTNSNNLFSNLGNPATSSSNIFGSLGQSNVSASVSIEPTNKPQFFPSPSKEVTATVSEQGSKKAEELKFNHTVKEQNQEQGVTKTQTYPVEKETVNLAETLVSKMETTSTPMFPNPPNQSPSTPKASSSFLKSDETSTFRVPDDEEDTPSPSPSKQSRRASPSNEVTPSRPRSKVSQPTSSGKTQNVVSKELVTPSRRLNRSVNGAQPRKILDSARYPHNLIVPDIPDEDMVHLVPSTYNDAQRKHFYAAYRMRALNNAMQTFFANVALGADVSHVLISYEQKRRDVLARAGMASGAGSKRKAAPSEEHQKPSKKSKTIEPMKTRPLPASARKAVVNGDSTHARQPPASARKPAPGEETFSFGPRLKESSLKNSFSSDCASENAPRPRINGNSSSKAIQSQPSAPPPGNSQPAGSQPVAPQSLAVTALAPSASTGKRKAENYLTKDDPTGEEAETAREVRRKIAAKAVEKASSASSALFKSILDTPSKTISEKSKMTTSESAHQNDTARINPFSSLKIPKPATKLPPTSPSKTTAEKSNVATSGSTQQDDAPRINPFSSLKIPKLATMPSLASPSSKTTTTNSNISTQKPLDVSAPSLKSSESTAKPPISVLGAATKSPAKSPIFGVAPSNTTSSTTPGNTLKLPTFGGAAPTNFLAQFGQQASKYKEDKEKKLMEDAKAEDMDSDDDEAEWEAAYKKKRQVELKELKELSKNKQAKFVAGQGFAFDQSQKIQPAKPTSIFGQATGSSVTTESVLNKKSLGVPDSVNDNIFGHLSNAGSPANTGNDEDDDSESDGSGPDADAENKDPNEKGSSTSSVPPVKTTASIFGLAPSVKFGASGTSTASNSGTSSPGGSLFDRISKDASGNPIRKLSAEEKENTQPSMTASIFGDTSSPFNSSFTKATVSPVDKTWKPENRIKFGSPTPVREGSPTPPTFSITAATPPMKDNSSSAGIFSKLAPDKATGSLLGSTSIPKLSSGIFGVTTDTKPPTASPGSTPIPKLSSGIFGVTTAVPKPSSGYFGIDTDLKRTMASPVSPPIPKQSPGYFGVTTDPKNAITSPVIPPIPKLSSGIFAPKDSKKTTTSPGSTSTPGPSSSVFGVTTDPKPISNLSGSSPLQQNSSLFSSAESKPTSVSFGSTTESKPTSIFGSSTGSKTAPGLFGSSTESKTVLGLFGSTTAATNPSSSLFGNSTSKPASAMFGNAVPKPAASSIFGSNNGFGLAPASASSSLLPSANASRATSLTTSPAGSVNGDSSGETDPDVEHHEQISLIGGGAGEEDEEVIHEVRVKALKFSSNGDGDKGSSWDTRGVGPLRVLKHKETQATRIVVRADPSGTVVLNKTVLPQVNYSASGKTLKLLVAGEDSKSLETWILQVKTPKLSEALATVLEANKNSK